MSARALARALYEAAALGASRGGVEAALACVEPDAVLDFDEISLLLEEIGSASVPARARGAGRESS